jgi:hypothetical protein
MIIKYFVLILMFSPVASFGQVVLSYQSNLDVYKPYTSLAQEYIKQNSKVSSKTQTVLASTPILKTEKHLIRVGLNYKRIEHIVKDRILQIPTYDHSNHQTVFVGNVPSKRDLVSISNAFGLHLDYNRFIFEKKFYKANFGATSELYLFEFYTSDYYRTSYKSNFIIPSEGEIDDAIHPLVRKEQNILKPVLSTISLYYLNTFQFTNKFSIGLRISAGTNLYSKWDQFRKYAWVGLGLELGFGTSKAMM